MTRKLAPKAITIIELVVITAFIALLASVTLPSLQTLEKRNGRTMCLSNLRQIGSASLLYASEDDDGQLVPLHLGNVRSDASYCISRGPWVWRLVLPIIYGGRTAVHPLEAGSMTSYKLMDPNVHPCGNPDWGASGRPLNQYIADLETFHCPADTGYPELDPEDWGGQYNMDSPPQSAGIPCWDFLGNSYRVNTCGFVWAYDGIDSPNPKWKAAFSSGPRGHAAMSIESPSSTVLYADPLFYLWSRYSPDIDPNVTTFPGWHGEITADNVAYCDGSARMTQAYPLSDFSQDELENMGFSSQFDDDSYYFLRRGPTWREDCHPTPGASIQVFHYMTGQSLLSNELDVYTGWPFDNYTENECMW